MGMTKYCWGGLAVLLFLVYLEYNVRKDWINSLTKDDVLNYLSNTFKWPTLYQLSLFPAYVAILFIGTLIVPGSHHVGTPIADGRKITFKINGLTLFFLLIIGGAVAHFTGVLPGTVIYDNFSSLFLIVNASAFLVSIYLYVAGTMKGEGKGKSFLDNFVIGTELMPFVFGQPLKMFWLKPSMMGWACINLSFLAKQYEILGHVSTPMILYQAFSLFYIIDYFYHEERMTSTWDIIAEHFGLMLVWGDIVFIPFVFSAQCWFLLHDDTHLEIWQIALMVLLFLTGYTIFRGCNSQKHEFKHNPKTLIWGKPAETIAGKLLVSGWWGVARHINYTGDILLGLGFSIPCLFHSVLPWVYPIYLTLLLVHREVRDHHRCHEKYGKTWDLYVKRVPYRMIPYIY